MTFPILGANSAVGGYSIDNSLRFNDNDSARLTKTFSAGNRDLFTWSGWVKRGNLSANMNLFREDTTFNILRFNSSNQLEYFNNIDSATIVTNALYRDVSGWYNIQFVYDSGNATASDRLQFYVNGERITSFSSSSYPSLNADSGFNSAVTHSIGARPAGTEPFDGYMAEVHFIDGQALSPTDFGEFDEDSGIWKPISYSGSYGSKGFYLDFENSGSLGADQSGNGNNFTPTNLASTDQMLDTPTNNFATLNPLANGGSALQEGSLECITSTGGFWGSGATQGITSGKWYMEFRDESGAGFFGITDDVSESIRAGSFLGVRSTEYCYAPVLARLYNNNSFTSFTTTGFGAGDVIGVAFDMDNKKIYYSVDGTFQNSQDPVNGTNPAQTVSSTPDTYFFAGSDGSGASSRTFQANFGQDSSFAGNKTRQNNSDENGYGDFFYAPPSGYLALCTQNLATELSPTIDDGSEYFQPITYSGNGGNQDISANFDIDLAWIKSRTNAYNHVLIDTLRGNSNRLYSNATDAESTLASPNEINLDGSTLDLNGGVSIYNASGNNYITWLWKAGGTGVTNTDGSITSTVSANTTAGFSVVTYTGTGANLTCGHGLGAVPKMIIIKDRDAVKNWIVYHEAVGNDRSLALNLTNAQTAVTDHWNYTTPTSSVFSLGPYSHVNASGDDYVAYCFADIEGYSKFGKWVGNGSTTDANRPFIYTGFRPAFVLWKDTNSATDWRMMDDKRNSYNVANSRLFPNSSSAENTGYSAVMDFLSNGFKIRGTHTTGINTSGNSYIYMAFAENPFVSSSGVPVVAR